jgi:hypothetical protein
MLKYIKMLKIIFDINTLKYSKYIKKFNLKKKLKILKDGLAYISKRSLNPI